VRVSSHTASITETASVSFLSQFGESAGPPQLYFFGKIVDGTWDESNKDYSGLSFLPPASHSGGLATL